MTTFGGDDAPNGAFLGYAEEKAEGKIWVEGWWEEDRQASARAANQAGPEAIERWLADDAAKHGGQEFDDLGREPIHDPAYRERMMEALKLAVDNEQKRDDGINEIVQRLRQLELRLGALEGDVGRLQR